MAISEPTAVFSIRDDKDQEIKQVMQLVYGALEEKGYNPVNPGRLYSFGGPDLYHYLQERSFADSPH